MQAFPNRIKRRAHKEAMTEPSKKEISKKELLVPLLPLRDIIVFPHMVVPLFVGREKSIHALEEALNHKKDILLVEVN